jgi:hypothetical protein
MAAEPLVRLARSTYVPTGISLRLSQRACDLYVTTDVQPGARWNREFCWIRQLS